MLDVQEELLGSSSSGPEATDRRPEDELRPAKTPRHRPKAPLVCLQDDVYTTTKECNKRANYHRRRASELEKQLNEVTGERDALLEKVS